MSRLSYTTRNFKIALFGAVPVYTLILLFIIASFLGVSLESGNSNIEWGILALVFIAFPLFGLTTLLLVQNNKNRKRKNLLLVLTIMIYILMIAFFINNLFISSELVDLNSIED